MFFFVPDATMSRWGSSYDRQINKKCSKPPTRILNLIWHPYSPNLACSSSAPASVSHRPEASLRISRPLVAFCLGLLNLYFRTWPVGGLIIVSCHPKVGRCLGKEQYSPIDFSKVIHHIYDRIGASTLSFIRLLHEISPILRLKLKTYLKLISKSTLSGGTLCMQLWLAHLFMEWQLHL